MRPFSRENIQDCYICAFRPAILFSLGVTYYSIPQCQHIHPVTKARFVRKRLVLILNLFYMVTLLSAIVINIRDINVNNSFEELMKKFITLVRCTNVLCFLISARMMNKHVMKYTKDIVNIIENRRYYGIQSILSGKQSKTLQTSVASVIVFTAVYVSTFVISSLLKNFGYKIIIYGTAKSIHDIIVVCVAFNLIFIEIIYHMILKNFNRIVKEHLSTALDKRNKNQIPFLVEKLQNLQKFYIAIYKNHKEHVLSVGNLVYYVSQVNNVIFVLVFTYLYYSYCWMNNIAAEYFFLCDVFVLTFITKVFFDKVDAVFHSNEDLLSYLYTYPISKLSESEAAQVEILITTLTLEKPELSASNIFTVGTDLLASIAGNVVTYVLVALQFHASFSKK
ncbi:hypothetical protein JTB14_037436 [Gonioctena quinquepunctata]|nr:hypothetical protein JTB14_037436 [Gonioctena quinquepunctata]